MAFKMKGYSPFTQPTGSAESLSEMISNATKTGSAEGLSEAVTSGAIKGGMGMMKTLTKKFLPKQYVPQTVKPPKQLIPQTVKDKFKNKLSKSLKKGWMEWGADTMASQAGNFSAMKQSEKEGEKMMKKEVQIKKKPNLKNMTTDALVDSLYSISQKPDGGDDSDDAKNFAAYKAEVLRREPDFDWGMNVDEMD